MFFLCNLCVLKGLGNLQIVEPMYRIYGDNEFIIFKQLYCVILRERHHKVVDISATDLTTLSIRDMRACLRWINHKGYFLVAHSTRNVLQKYVFIHIRIL